MNKTIETIKETRLNLLKFVDDLTVDQLNEVPQGFNNNIIWNLGHVAAALLGVCYLRAGLKTRIDEAFYLRYKPDTKPEGYIDGSEVEKIKSLLFSTLGQFETDYRENLFVNYTAWTTRYGVELKDINDAVQFLLFHEGLHLGYVMALKRLVKNNQGL